MTTLEPQRSMLRAAGFRRRLPERSTRAKETLRRIEELTAVSLRATESALAAWQGAEEPSWREPPAIEG